MSTIPKTTRELRVLSNPEVRSGDDVLLSPEAALARSGGISDSTRRRLIKAGDYPAPIVLSRDRHGKPARVAWIDREVREWARRKIAESRGEGAA
jgi:predicted DNA-binding transcriptional regulator AlpA